MTEMKAFKPTPKKLQEGRKKGKVLKSQVLSQSGAVFGGVLGLLWLGRSTLVKNRMLLEYGLLGGWQDLGRVCLEFGKVAIICMLCCLVLSATVSVTIEVLQVGFRFEIGALRPKADFLNLGKGVQKTFGGLKKFPVTLLKLSLLLFVLIWFLYSLIILASELFLVGGGDQSLLNVLSPFLIGSSLLLLLFGCVDYMFRRSEFLREMSMSAEEIKRETREDEGDPQVRSMRRSLHESLAREEIVARVRKSKVVVVEKQ